MNDVKQAAFKLADRNPDVLTCIANLSNDEVFTPPDFANQMLDTLEQGWLETHGTNIWSDSRLTFLDPFTKSGVFLREITKRLVDGLVDEIPDLKQRVDHVLTKQVYGIAITELTSLIARRSLYCSKWANGQHSIATSFDTKEGNIWFERSEHVWQGGKTRISTADENGEPIERFTDGKCKYCGASQLAAEASGTAENHASGFLHTADINSRISELFGEEMQFDVIIGNPPYQTKGSGGGSNDGAIYHLFVEQALRLEPRFLSMVIQSRWMAGGRNLKDFRNDFLADTRVRKLVDYENAEDVFPSVGIGGGACYFLWDRDNPGACECTFHRNGESVGPVTRSLDDQDVFVRDPRALTILQKVLSRIDGSLEEIVSGDTPFGLATNFREFNEGDNPKSGELVLYANRGTTRIQGSMDRSHVKKNEQLIDSWKLLLPASGSGRERERTGTDLVLAPSILAAPGSACTQTYLAAGPMTSKQSTQSLQSYIETRFVRFLISLRKPAQHVFAKMYRWVPLETWDRVWTDEMLYKKYGITIEEQEFIESMIRPMEPAGSSIG